MKMRLEERLSKWVELPEDDETDDDYGLIIDDSVTAEPSKMQPPRFNKAGSCSLLPSSTIMSPSALLPANLHTINKQWMKASGGKADILQRYVESADNENYDDLVLPEEEDMLDKQLAEWKTPCKKMPSWISHGDSDSCVEVTMSGATAVELSAYDSSSRLSVVDSTPTLVAGLSDAQRSYEETEDWVLVAAGSAPRSANARSRKSTPRAAAMALGLGLNLVQPVRAVLNTGSRQRASTTKPWMADWQHVEIPPPQQLSALTETPPQQKQQLLLKPSRIIHTAQLQQRPPTPRRLNTSQPQHSKPMISPLPQPQQLSMHTPMSSESVSVSTHTPSSASVSVTALRSPSKKPILIKAAQKPLEPVVIGAMRYDPISRIWIGNEDEGSRIANAIAESERRLRTRSITRSDRLIDTDKLARKISQRSGNPNPVPTLPEKIIIDGDDQEPTSWHKTSPIISSIQPVSPRSPQAKLGAAGRGRPALIPPSAAAMVGQSAGSSGGSAINSGCGRAKPIFDPQNLRWIDPNENRSDPSSNPFWNITELPVEPNSLANAFSGRIRSASEAVGPDIPNRSCFVLTDEQIEAYQREGAEYESFARHWFPKSSST
ncbi:hypothetical protein IWW45_003240 [Coemansia sp. RSA 485]|nr:hypothetical protein IWW45_003240 [Coemansia sp. RSA 485]